MAKGLERIPSVPNVVLRENSRLRTFSPAPQRETAPPTAVGAAAETPRIRAEEKVHRLLDADLPFLPLACMYETVTLLRSPSPHDPPPPHDPPLPHPPHRLALSHFCCPCDFSQDYDGDDDNGGKNVVKTHGESVTFPGPNYRYRMSRKSLSLPCESTKNR